MMFSQLLRYPAFYAAVAVAGFSFGVWVRGKVKLFYHVPLSALHGRPGLDPRVGDI